MEILLFHRVSLTPVHSPAPERYSSNTRSQIPPIVFCTMGQDAKGRRPSMCCFLLHVMTFLKRLL